MFRSFVRPGQGFRKFERLVRDGDVTRAGRPIPGAMVRKGFITGILSQSTQKEQEQWKQNGHPITHTIVQRGSENRANATDILQIVEFGSPRIFLVQGFEDPGELGHFTIYHVQERDDLI